MIYLDNAATSLKKPDVVIDAVVEAMKTMGNAGRGATEEALNTARTIFSARANICELLHGESPSQVAFMSNSTEALNTAIKGLLGSDDHIISSVMEHNSVLRPLHELEKQGARVTYVPTDEHGVLDTETLYHAIEPETKAVVLTHASNLTGNVNPVEEIGRWCQEHDMLFIVDASQTLGALPVDVQACHIDVLCFTGHKSLYGPQGTGGLYVRPGVTIRPLKSGGSGIQTFNPDHPTEMPTALEAGTMNGHGLAGLNAALEFLLAYGVENIAQEEREMTNYFYQAVENIPGIKTYGQFLPHIPHVPVVALNLRDLDSSEVADELLEEYDIETRSGGHCAPKMHEALGTEKQGIVRFSFSHFTTKEELDQAIQALQELASC